MEYEKDKVHDETFEGAGMGMFIFVRCIKGFADAYVHQNLRSYAEKYATYCVAIIPQ